MDAQLTAAARALDAGDVLGALKCVALRNDAAGLGLRGIVFARLGQFERARELLRSAARAFGPSAPVGRARCLLADAEIALASRDLHGLEAALASATRILWAHGDAANAAHAVCLTARSQLLRGRVEEARRTLSGLTIAPPQAALRAEVELTRAELHLRALETRAARSALVRAERAAQLAQIPAILREVSRAQARLVAPAARELRGAREKPLKPEEIETLLGQKRTLVVDAREFAVRTPGQRVSLARRPVLFALARALAAAWPNAAPRGELIERAFSAARSNETHRARLRVEIARLRRALRELAGVHATADGFQLTPLTASEVVVLARLVDDEHAALLVLLEDGEAWSSSALAVALGASQRSAQRALLVLEEAGKVRATGRARAKRWLCAPSPAFATPLLLPTSLEIA